MDTESKDEEINICRCVVPHSDNDAASVSSKAVVKYQTVQSPANFAKLQWNTDLKLPPSNWLTNSLNSYGLRQTLSHPAGFTSFRMAHMFPDCLGEVDVVSSAENIKNILKLPYSPKSTISLMVHRVENTLLIDEFDIYRYLLRQADTDWQWLKTFICEQVICSRNFSIKNKSREALQKKSLLSKFLYHSLPSTSDDLIAETDNVESDLALRLDSIGEANSNKLRVRHSINVRNPDLPEPSVDENVPEPQTNHVHNRNVVWTFEDIRMLVGTDMPIFGNNTRPCISLRLRDMTEPINVLTGIDYWLDNLMCNVPEVVMCYHLDGFVQKYEIIKTEDLPHLEDSNFSPKVIRNVAQHILTFLKQKATKAGHTYWLFKGRNDDFVKLYDLTSLSTAEMENGPGTSGTGAGGNSSDCSDSKADTNENPFTVPVGMLLYKVAKNIKANVGNMSAQQAGSIKALLDNCLKLLPKEKYPQIVTSSHYILSDLHVPIGIDPNAPNFMFGNSADSDTQSVYDDEKYQTDQNDNDLDVASHDDLLTETISIKNIRDSFNEIDKNWKNNSRTVPMPITSDLEERCTTALEHIADGLSCLQYFSKNEEKLTQEKVEMIKQEEKRRIIYEEQNPTMAKSSQAIPMPYQSLSPEPDMSNPNVPIPMGWKEVEPTNTPETIVGKKTKRNRKKGKKSTEDKSVELSPRSLQLQEKTEVIVTWNVHLKLLLLEKACLVYAILTKQAYDTKQFGKALKNIFIAMKCKCLLSKHMPLVVSQDQDFLQRIGDCYYQLAQHVNDIGDHLSEFHLKDCFDQTIEQEVDKEIDFNESFPFPDPSDSVEQLLMASCACYERALLECSGAFGSMSEKRREIISRLGCVRNELGQKYMFWAETEFNNFIGDPQNASTEKGIVYQTLVKKSYELLQGGIVAFEEVNDNVNLVIMLCSMGRFWRLRAYIASGSKDITLVKKCYEDSFSSYQRAFAILESKRKNPQLWDVIAWELSTSRFMLAQQLSDYNSVTYEQDIIDLLLNTLKLCDTETSGSRQIQYMLRVGLVHNRLATIYYNSYKRETNDIRKKKLLQLTRLYYEKASKSFEELEAPKEYIDVQLNRLDLQDDLCNGTQAPQPKMRHLLISLDIIQQSSVIFDKILRNKEFTDDTIELMQRYEQRIQTIFRGLVKLTMAKVFSDRERSVFKKIYGLSLRSPTKLDAEQLATHMKQMLEKVHENCLAEDLKM